MVAYVLAAASVRFLLPTGAAERTATQLTRWASRFVLKILRLTVVTEGRWPRRGTSLFIANHISYIDVMLIAASVNSTFVTSREIEVTPGLGWICKAAGCAFVERRRRSQISRDLADLAGILASGKNLTLFPEGTTSAGDALLPFKSSLLEAAIRSRCAVIPLCLRYEFIGGEAFCQANHDAVAWYGTMTFLPHLWRLLKTPSITARLTILDPIAFRHHGCRKRLTLEARTQIEGRFFRSPADSRWGG